MEKKKMIEQIDEIILGLQDQIAKLNAIKNAAQAVAPEAPAEPVAEAPVAEAAPVAPEAPAPAAPVLDVDSNGNPLV